MPVVTTPPSTLNPEQQEVFDLLVSGKDVFLSGNAGTGKSYVINQYIDYLERLDKQVIICAFTGIAASNFASGTTIHKAFSLKTQNVYDRSKYYVLNDKISIADVVIIDEISMCRCDLLDVVLKLVNIARKKNSNHRCQLILVGDFFQLPPILPREDLETFKELYPHTQGGYAFAARSWGKHTFQMRILQTTVRQQEKEIVNNLNMLRMGDEACLPYFNTFVRSDYEACKGVFIAGTNAEVDHHNDTALAKLDGSEAQYVGESDNYPENHFPFPDELMVKRDARVMALYNHEDGLFVNGSLGNVVDFDEESVTVNFDNGNTVRVTEHRWRKTEPVVVEGKNGKKRLQEQEVASYTRIPLRLAYAITIHKSQGQTFDSIVVNPESFADGQLYVALSRCTKPEGLALTKKIEPEYLKASEEVRKWYAQALETQKMQKGNNTD